MKSNRAAEIIARNRVLNQAAAVPIAETLLFSRVVGEGGQGGIDAQDLPIASIVPDPGNPRSASEFTNEAHLEMVASVRENGIIQPIIVRPHGDGKFMIICGERRWRAATDASLASIPAVVRRIADDGEIRMIQLVENWAATRVSVTPFSEGAAMAGLLDVYKTQSALAAKLGTTQGVVAKRLALGRAPPILREKYEQGAIKDIEAAYALARFHDERPDEFQSRVEGITPDRPFHRGMIKDLDKGKPRKPRAPSPQQRRSNPLAGVSDAEMLDRLAEASAATGARLTWSDDHSLRLEGGRALIADTLRRALHLGD